MNRFIGFLGLATLLGIAYLMSNNRRQVKLHTILVGTGIQFCLGIILLWWKPGANAFQWLSEKVYSFLKLSQVGIDLLFGELGKPDNYITYGTQVAFIIASTIIFFSAFIAILYHWGIMQFFVGVVARFMRWAMRTSGSPGRTCHSRHRNHHRSYLGRHIS